MYLNKSSLREVNAKNCLFIGSLNNFVKCPFTKFIATGAKFSGGKLEEALKASRLTQLSLQLTSGIEDSQLDKICPTTLYWISCYAGTSSTAVDQDKSTGFSWGGIGSTGRTFLLACENVKITSGAEQYIKDMAILPLYGSLPSDPWYKIISIHADVNTESPEVSSAISTIQSKGVTVIITALAKPIMSRAVNTIEKWGIAVRNGVAISQPFNTANTKVFPSDGVSVRVFTTREEAEELITF